MIGDGAGGATLTWQDFRSGTNYNIYAQRMSAAGTPQWAPNGAEVCFETDDQQFPMIASDGGTGAIIAWFDRRSNQTGDDIYAQRITTAAGAQQWTPNGVPLCTALNNQEYPTIAADGGGGAFVTWQDHRGADYDIYLHRINPDGAIVSVPTSDAGSLARGRAWPSPFFDRVQMEFVLPASMPVRMEVLDVRGRRAWESESMPLTAGKHVLAWDGQTSDGRMAADGVYFLRVRGSGLEVSRRVVRLK
jgi:Fe-S cluster biogenesis protein NfuA